MRAVGVNITLKNSFKIHMVGILFTPFIPSGAGCDVVKSLYIYRWVPEKKSIAIASIFIDRIIGIYALVVVAIVATLSIKFDTINIKWYLFIYMILLISLTLFFVFAFTNT